MEKLKKFCKDHKKELIVAGCVVGAIAIGLMTKGKGKRELLDVTGQNYLTWRPGNYYMNLERVKEILDLNANNSEHFAIIRGYKNPDVYKCIMITENVVL